MNPRGKPFIPPHPIDNCSKKVRYTTEIAARMGAQSVVTNHNLPDSPERLWVYRCPYCWGWHCTSKEPFEKTPAVTKRELYAAG